MRYFLHVNRRLEIAAPALLAGLLASACGPGGQEGGPGREAAPAARGGTQGEAAATVPEEEPATMAEGVARLRLGRATEAVEILRQVCEARPDDITARFYLARALNADTKLGEAEEAYRAVLAVDPTLAEAWLHLSGVYIEEGRLPEALECLQALGQARGRGPTLDYQEGFVLSKMGRFADAEAMLRRALEQRPSFPDAWYILGVNSQRAGEDAKALAAFENVLRIDPSYADAWYNMGNTLARLGRTEEAEKALERFASENVAREQAKARASNLSALSKGAEMDFLDGDLDRAEEQVAEAEAIDPGLPWVQRIRGELALARGDTEAALEHLRRAAALNPADADEQFALAAAFRKAGDAEAAARHQQEAQRLLQVGTERRP